MFDFFNLGPFPAMMHNYEFEIYKSKKLILNPAKQHRFWNYKLELV